MVQDVKQRVGSIKNETAASTAADISQLLSIASAELSQAREALELLKSKIETELAQALAELNREQIESQQARDNLKNIGQAFADALPAAVDSPQEMIDSLPAVFTAIDNAWRAALPDTPPVVVKLDAQDYLGAVTAAVRRDVMLGTTEEDAEDWTELIHSVASSARPMMSRQTIFGIALPAAEEPVEVRTKNQLLWDKSLQSFILFVLVAVGGLSTYHATFVGNLDDALKIFFWAFSIDITVDAVRTALKPKVGY